MRAARDHLRSAHTRGGVVLVAMGGFVCPPAVRAARRAGVPVVLVNLDSVPGRANRWVASRAGRVITSCPISGQAWEAVGPIVRAQARPSGEARACRVSLGLDPDARTLFVSGGSQGAGTINDFVPGLAAHNTPAFEGWQIIHQTGEGRSDAVDDRYRDAGVRARALDFIDRIGDAWGAADLAIARSGAGSVAEAWASRTPTVFMPFPHHGDDHQRANAAALVRCGGALVLEDHADATRNLGEHAPAVFELLADADRRVGMRAGLEGLGSPDGARRAAEILAGGR